MNPTATAAIQTSKPFRTGHVIMADGSKTVPTQIEIIRAGNWPASSMKGPLNITTADLQEFKANFDAGVGMPDELKQLPIDFSHNDWREAAGWIKSLEVVGESLMATVEWSTEGQEALEGGMFKCISPSFYPACCGEWYDPEDSETTARNVLVGAGLTNIPFFKSLTPIMASTTSGNDGKVQQENIIYIQADDKKETITMPTLDEVRVKEADQLTDDEKQLLSDSKSELSAEELTKFNLTEAEPAADPTNTNKKTEEEPVADPELEAVTASIKSGEMIAVKASTFKGMQDTLGELQRDKVEASVKTHLARGAIKADQIKDWTDRIVKDPTLETALAALPDNPVMASEYGSSTQEQTIEDAQAELHQKVVAARSEEQHKGKSYSQIRTAVLADKENASLAELIKADDKVAATNGGSN